MEVGGLSPRRKEGRACACRGAARALVCVCVCVCVFVSEGCGCRAVRGSVRRFVPLRSAGHRRNGDHAAPARPHVVPALPAKSTETSCPPPPLPLPPGAGEPSHDHRSIGSHGADLSPERAPFHGDWLQPLPLSRSHRRRSLAWKKHRSRAPHDSRSIDPCPLRSRTQGARRSSQSNAREDNHEGPRHRALASRLLKSPSFVTTDGGAAWRRPKNDRAHAPAWRAPRAPGRHHTCHTPSSHSYLDGSSNKGLRTAAW